MAKNKELKNPITVPVVVEKEQCDFIDSKGINRSKLMRLAIEAVRSGKLIYKFI